MDKPVHRPISWYVSKWTDDPLCLGAWSQLLVDGSPSDRSNLGKPVSPSFIIAGEACDPDMPGMVHGAYKSGLVAAESVLSGGIPENGLVVIIGAGASGIAAAKVIIERNKSNAKVLILEARNRLGGRVNTISVCGKGEEDEVVFADAGATWLHQYPVNMLADTATSLKLDLISSDFQNPLRASIDDDEYIDDDLVKYFATLVTKEANSSQSNKSLTHVIDKVRSVYGTPIHQRSIDKSVVDVMSDSGITTDELSARYGLEPGVGNTDKFMKSGFSSLISHLADGLPIKYNTVVSSINWGGPDARTVELKTSTGEVIIADRCISTVPLSLYKENSTLTIQPELPELHRRSLDLMKLGICEKVILRFEDRWLPVNPGGILRW